ncbi:hypothetical protein SAMN05192546_10517 [Tindallia californiensis]|uniref:Uncharacterized protein n=1 Tax=Tindallia californiensis TaxID=159292 RepID=A0A1H3N9S1_9FIRM|nr:hypothetical protein SAMN05192546_10517 [Tindallia californiensis]
MIIELTDSLVQSMKKRKKKTITVEEKTRKYC